MALVVKNPPANAEGAGEVGSIPGSGRPPGVGNGNPLQYSCLENPLGRGAWWATVHGVAKSPRQLNMRAHTHTPIVILQSFRAVVILPLILSHFHYFKAFFSL